VALGRGLLSSLRRRVPQERRSGLCTLAAPKDRRGKAPEGDQGHWHGKCVGSFAFQLRKKQFDEKYKTLFPF
jgi:hypothetical protein